MFTASLTALVLVTGLGPRSATSAGAEADPCIYWPGGSYVSPTAEEWAAAAAKFDRSLKHYARDYLLRPSYAKQKRLRRYWYRWKYYAFNNIRQRLHRHRRNRPRPRVWDVPLGQGFGWSLEDESVRTTNKCRDVNTNRVRFYADFWADFRSSNGYRYYDRGGSLLMDVAPSGRVMLFTPV